MMVKKVFRWLAFCACAGFATIGTAQTAYFVDGFHGGVYGHYPPRFTQFIVDSMNAHPDWKINLEIEPETWDSVSTNDPAAFAEFQKLAADQSTRGRVEFINPAYGQSYLWDISGESIIQQLDRGMAKIREHFPNAQFKTYSSEEPCFTSALPGILKSFGIEHAVLKNPNTCWGGYMQAFGGELVNWIGPDGTSITTVPRYGIEALSTTSTWETIGNANLPQYVETALAAGIPHPVGMCIQDAGWRFGPWLSHVGQSYQPTESTLWRHYFENIAQPTNMQTWRVSQEDVRVSLVWGAQVLQRIAQEVHASENKIFMAEKMATMAGVANAMPWPGETFDEAWRTLLLSQHHDCWIVPYNGRRGSTWIDKVAQWTGSTDQRADDVINHAVTSLLPAQTGGKEYFVRVFNTLANARTNLVSVELPEELRDPLIKILNAKGREVSSQLVPKGNNSRDLEFLASVPSFGYDTYRIEKTESISAKPPLPAVQTNGLVILDTDLYRLALDVNHGGTIQSLVAKHMGGKELVDAQNQRRFNELRGYFFNDGKYFSTADSPARVEIVENGPLRFVARIYGSVNSSPVTQTIALNRGEPRIDFSTRIDWRGSSGIGSDFMQSGEFMREQDRKAFYDDRFKLVELFPVNLPQQMIYKDAPFDVCRSDLTDTFFQNWSSIKNNIILNWVDAYDPAQKTGLSLLTDHTTSYTHGTNFPLGLTMQYSGVGLWGRQYSLNGPSEIHFALLPHMDDWQQSKVWLAGRAWNEPLIAKVFASAAAPAESSRSYAKFERDDWEIPVALFRDGKFLFRVFAPSTLPSEKTLHFPEKIAKAELVRLDGQLLHELPIIRIDGDYTVKIALPPFAVGTLRVTPAAGR